MSYPEIYKGQRYNIEGEIYELTEFRVTAVSSPTDFITTAFFKSQNSNSENPIFEEQIKRIIGNSIFKII